MKTTKKKDSSTEFDFEIIDTNWLDVHSLGGDEYNFGFWNFELVRFGGQRSLNFKSVSQTRFFDILTNNGFCKRYRENGTFLLIHNKDNILTIVNSTQIKDFVLKLLSKLPDEIDLLEFKVKTEKLREKFLKEHNYLFNESALSPLNNHDTPLLSDSKKTMYFPFLNGVVEVTNERAHLKKYSELDNLCVWKQHIIQRIITPSHEESMYEVFLRNVSNNDETRINAMRAAIGYCLHRYYNEVNTKAVILYDEQITDSNSANGGTGKGLFVGGISKMRNAEIVDGKKFSPTDKFSLQRINELTEIVFFDDVRPDFEFERFNSILTNGWEIEAKNQKTIRIPLGDSPKMIIASNSVLKAKDGFTAERRQFILEFSDFYVKLKNKSQEPIVMVHGCVFFYSWDENEWNRFYSFMIKSCVYYLKHGLPIVKSINVVYNRLLQNTSKEFVNWVKEKSFLENKQYLFSEYYEDFKSLYYGDSTTFSIFNFTKWMTYYAKTIGCEYTPIRFSGKSYFIFK